MSFKKNRHPEYAAIGINDKPIEIVTTIKLMGLNISNNRDLTILGWQRDGNGYQYNRSLKNYNI
jgi:hypothetical protein